MTVDIHGAKERLEASKNRITRRYSSDNAMICNRFLTRLRLENKSYGRVCNYADCIIRMLKIKDDSCIRNWSRDDIEMIHQKIADSDHTNSVKKSTLSTLKRLYHFAIHDTIPDKSKGDEYDPTVSWITPGTFADKYHKIQPKDLLSDAELLELIRAVKIIGGRYVKRNIAMLFLMLEGAYRPGELFNITIGGIEFEDDFVRVHTTGKTGPKSLALVASFEPLKEWLAEHPYGSDHDTFLLYDDNKQRLLEYKEFLRILAKARKKSGIKKKVWPYLFRHTALTEYSKKLGNIVKIYGNWSVRSNALTTYEHLANSDQEEAVLTLHGIKKESKEESILFFKICPSCKQKNTQDKSHCIHCGQILAKNVVHNTQNMLSSKPRTSEFDIHKTIRGLQSIILEQNNRISKQDKLLEQLFHNR